MVGTKKTRINIKVKAFLAWLPPYDISDSSRNSMLILVREFLEQFASRVGSVNIFVWIQVVLIYTGSSVFRGSIHSACAKREECLPSHNVNMADARGLYMNEG